MKFLNKLIRTSVDFEGHNSLLIHSLVGCNFKCFGCHNYEDLVSKKHDKFYTEKDIIDKIKLNGFMFDAIILSGGEFLLNKESEIINFLKKIRLEFNGKIIINTNGTSPYMIKYLSKHNLVDGFHMDIKFNIWEEKDIDLICKVIGKIIEKSIFIKSFNTVKKYNKGYSEFRTVKYPFLDEEYFKKIELKCKEEDVKWRLNDFIKLK